VVIALPVNRSSSNGRVSDRIQTVVKLAGLPEIVAQMGLGVCD